MFFKVCKASEKPDSLKPGILYAVGENNHLWFVSLLCPCGCGDFLDLNTLKDTSPCWTLSINKSLPSLSPSINRIVGCKSHFFLREGKIIWCGK